MTRSDIVRWIGPDIVGLHTLVAHEEEVLRYAAQVLADHLVDDDLSVSWLKVSMAHYARRRAETRRLRELADRCYSSANVGRWAGYLVEDDEAAL